MNRIRKTYIYFLYAPYSNVIKIGITRDIKQRLRDIGAASPEPLILLKLILGNFKKERALHERFKNYRQHYEWFTLNPELLDYIGGLEGVEICPGKTP